MTRDYNKHSRSVTRMLNRLPDMIRASIKHHYDVHVYRAELKRLQRYDTTDERKLTAIYYRVPGYGVVKADDLYSLRCCSYLSKHNLCAFLDSLLHPSCSLEVHIRWVILD